MQEEKNNKNISLLKNIEPKKTKVFFSKMMSIILGTLGIVIVLLIIGVGALLSGHVWNPHWNPFKPNSDKTFRESILRHIK